MSGKKRKLKTGVCKYCSTIFPCADGKAKICDACKTARSICSCGNRKSTGSKTCIECRDRLKTFGISSHKEDCNCFICKAKRGTPNIPWNKGKFMSEEYCRIQSEAHKGIYPSDETRKKLSLSRQGEKHWNWKNGVHQDHQRGYISLSMPDYPGSNKSGKIAQHRYVVEQFIGRLLTKEEVVHHIDGSTRNNSLENLYVCSCKAEHKAYEMLEYFGKPVLLISNLKDLRKENERNRGIVKSD